LTVGLVGLTPAQAAAPSSLTVVVLTSGVQVQPPAGYTQSLTAVTASPAESWKLTLSSPTGCESSGPPYCTGSWLLAGQSNDTLVGNWSHFEDCWAFSVTGGGGRFAGVTASSAAQSRFPEALGYCAVSGISVSSIIPIGVLSDIPVGLLTFKFGT
jgi:hypothetical protein